jgi:hypothetical protein
MHHTENSGPMKRKTPMKIFAVAAALALVAVALPVLAQSPGGGGSQAANKIVVAGASYLVMTDDTEESATASLFEDPVPTVKTSKRSDLLIQVNMECSVLTQTFVSNNPLFGPQISRAEGRIVVWVEINGVVVPVDKYDVADEATGNVPGEVVFCDRAHEKEFREIMEEDEEHGFNATIRDFQRTRGAHSFTWIALDVGFNHPDTRDHTIEVFARLEAGTENDPDDSPQNALAEAVVGKRTLIVEPVKLSRHAEI